MNICKDLKTLVYTTITVCIFYKCAVSSFIFAEQIKVEHKSETVITILTEKSSLLNYVDENDSKLKGYVGELITAVMDDTGLNYKIVIKPWARAYREAINNKNTFIYSVGRTPERENKLMWIGKILTVQNYIYKLKSNKLPTTNSLEDYKDSTILVSRGSMNHNFLRDNGFENLISATSYKQVLRLLERNRAQYLASSVLGAEQFVKETDINSNDIIPVLRLHHVELTLYFAANLKTDPYLVDVIQKSYQKIIDNGTYDRIMQPLLKKQLTLRNSPLGSGASRDLLKK